MDNQSKGKRGEALAEAYLVEHGYWILARRYRCQRGENDLIAQRGNTLCFCEVKARSGLRYGSGAEAVTRTKRFAATQAAMHYLMEHPHQGPLLFDVLEVDLSTGQVQHIPSAFEAVLD